MPWPHALIPDLNLITLHLFCSSLTIFFVTSPIVCNLSNSPGTFSTHSLCPLSLWLKVSSSLPPPSPTHTQTQHIHPTFTQLSTLRLCSTISLSKRRVHTTVLTHLTLFQVLLCCFIFLVFCMCSFAYCLSSSLARKLHDVRNSVAFIHNYIPGV